MSLRTRIISSVVLVPILAAVIIVFPPFIFASMVLLIIVTASIEWFAMNGNKPSERMPAIFITALIPLGLFFMGPAFFSLFLPVFILAGALWAVTMKGTPRERLAALQETTTAVFFIGLPLGFFVLIRGLPCGRGLIFFLLITIWLVDTAAYFGGVSFGRRRMSPVLSPNKTIEGLITGLGAGLIGGALIGPFLTGTNPVATGMIGLLLGLLGQLGDLLESLWKRAAGKKDSGTMIPGHGGILDRIDSFLLTAPALYYTFFLTGC